MAQPPAPPASTKTAPPLAGIVLAAGKGTRMKSARAKVLHEVAGRPMIEYPIQILRELGATRVVCVLGHQVDEVRAAVDARFGVGAVDVALQAEQRGTGHAVAQAEAALAGLADADVPVLILCGDVPLLTPGLLARLVEARGTGLVSLVTTRMPDPTGYGRIVRDGSGRAVRIVEHKDASPAERAIDEINSGIYCVRASFLFPALRKLSTHNAQGELYLTDILAQASALGEPAHTVDASADEVMGVNDRVDLARADHLMRQRVHVGLMRSGVTIHAPETCFVDAGVEVGEDTELGPLVQLRGATRIGRNVRIDAGCVLLDAVIGDGVHLKPYTVVSGSTVGDEAHIGPFAHLRPESLIGAHAKIGNFVETKKVRFGDGAKASHLSYLGDAEIGAGANIGCGTITCNYDGYRKSRTVIGEGAFIGSDTQLVAPVTVGAYAVVAAGTTVTRDVSPGALAVARAPQTEIAGYADKKRRREEALAAKKAADTKSK